MRYGEVGDVQPCMIGMRPADQPWLAHVEIASPCQDCPTASHKLYTVRSDEYGATSMELRDKLLTLQGNRSSPAMWHPCLADCTAHLTVGFGLVS